MFRMRARPAGALPKSKLLAVLPAFDASGEEKGALRGAGISASLRRKLQGISGVQVMLPSGSAESREQDPVKAARDTGANIILQPSVRQVRDKIQVSYSLALAASPVQIDAGEVTGAETDLFALENELAKKICKSLELRFAVGGGQLQREEISKADWQADYFIALGHLERRDDPIQVQKAIGLLRRIPGGEDSALVQAGLGRAYIQSYWRSADVAEAELAKKTTERAISLDPTLHEAQVTLGNLLIATGKPEGAVEVLKKALEARPDDPEAILNLANALERSGRLSEAEDAYIRLVELRPTSWSSFNQLGGFYFVAKTEYTKAASAYRKAIDLNAAVAPPHTNLGAILNRLGRFDEAIVEFERSIAIQPSPKGYSNLGTTLFDLGRFAEAVDAFEKAIALAPKNFRWRTYLASSLEKSPARKNDARRAYTEALALGEEELRVDPTNAQTRVSVAGCLASLGQRDRAWTETLRAVQAAPSSPEVLVRAATNAVVLGQKAEAIRWLKTAVAKGLPVSAIKDRFRELNDDPSFKALASGR